MRLPRATRCTRGEVGRGGRVHYTVGWMEVVVVEVGGWGRGEKGGETVRQRERERERERERVTEDGERELQKMEKERYRGERERERDRYRRDTEERGTE